MTVQARFVATLVDEWARAGVRHAVISPGSRSSPLSLALLADSRITAHVRLDERSGAFFAIGLSRASSSPVVVVTTSGTAAVELHPAVVEADLSKVPIICATADRPVELHGVGASQTIDQAGLFGGATRFSCDLGVAEEANEPQWRSFASRIVLEVVTSPRGPGPVHVNLAFREPLIALSPPALDGRSGGRPWHERRGAPALDDEALERLCSYLSPSRRGVIVVGERGCPEADPRHLVELATLLGWPLIADPRAFPREPNWPVVAHADGIFRSELARRTLRPEVVLRFGSGPLSKALDAHLSSLGALEVTHLVVDAFGSFEDPARSSTVVFAGDPTTVAHRCSEHLRAVDRDAEPVKGWRERFEEADRAIDQAVANVLDEVKGSSEPGTLRAIYAELPNDATLVCSASMAIRDLEWFAAPRAGAPRVVFNNGANGIDGVVSTMLGVAAGAHAGGPLRPPVVGVIGDLAFFHDLSGLVWGTLESVPQICLVVLDNGGGGIFSFVADTDTLDHEVFERVFATPQRPDCAEVARALGARVVDDLDRPIGELLAEAERTPGVTVVVVRTQRGANRELHDALADAAVRAVDAVLAGLD